MDKKKHAKISLNAVRLGEHLRRKARKQEGEGNHATLEPEHCDKVIENPPDNDEERSSLPKR